MISFASLILAQKIMLFVKKRIFMCRKIKECGIYAKHQHFLRKLILRGILKCVFVGKRSKSNVLCEKSHFDVKKHVRMLNLCKRLVQNQNMSKCGINASYLTLHLEKRLILAKKVRVLPYIFW